MSCSLQVHRGSSAGFGECLHGGFGVMPEPGAGGVDLWVVVTVTQAGCPPQLP
jgi:hypothetical protein